MSMRTNHVIMVDVSYHPTTVSMKNMIAASARPQIWAILYPFSPSMRAPF
ncbi:MAG: hypothetical protein H0V75_04115 [Rubrobacter sp.]|jgi:hypothetical protein|nr:hypothetical protein [Rubrobacter sp.]